MPRSAARTSANRCGAWRQPPQCRRRRLLGGRRGSRVSNRLQRGRCELVPTLTVSGRSIGPEHPCYVIAEAGSNHNRDLDTARKLIDVAADAGADAVKFQTYSGTTLYSKNTPRFDFLDDELADIPAHQLL